MSYRSNSIYRSAAALLALFTLRIANFNHFYESFLASVAEVEPIFHLETLTKTLADSNPEKMQLTLLVHLVRHSISVHRPRYGPMPETLDDASQLRQRTFEMLDLYRIYLANGVHHTNSPDSLILILHNGCSIYSECYSLAMSRAYDDYDEPICKLESILEQLYNLTIFLNHCIILRFQLLTNALGRVQLERLVLLAYKSWIQDCVTEVLAYYGGCLRYLESTSKLLSVAHVYVQPFTLASNRQLILLSLSIVSCSAHTSLIINISIVICTMTHFRKQSGLKQREASTQMCATSKRKHGFRELVDSFFPLRNLTEKSGTLRLQGIPFYRCHRLDNIGEYTRIWNWSARANELCNILHSTWASLRTI